MIKLSLKKVRLTTTGYIMGEPHDSKGYRGIGEPLYRATWTDTETGDDRTIELRARDRKHALAQVDGLGDLALEHEHASLATLQSTHRTTLRAGCWAELNMQSHWTEPARWQRVLFCGFDRDGRLTYRLNHGFEIQSLPGGDRWRMRRCEQPKPLDVLHRFRFQPFTDGAAIGVVVWATGRDERDAVTFRVRARCLKSGTSQWSTLKAGTVLAQSWGAGSPVNADDSQALLAHALRCLEDDCEEGSDLAEAFSLAALEIEESNGDVYADDAIGGAL